MEFTANRDGQSGLTSRNNVSRKCGEASTVNSFLSDVSGSLDTSETMLKTVTCISLSWEHISAVSIKYLVSASQIQISGALSTAGMSIWSVFGMARRRYLPLLLRIRNPAICMAGLSSS